MRDGVTRVNKTQKEKTAFSEGRRRQPGDLKVAQGPAGQASRPFRCLECDFWDTRVC